MAEKHPQTEGAVNPPAIKNPYREGTKMFTVAKRLLSGDGDSKLIAKEVGVNVHSVYNARSALHKLGYKVTKAGEAPEEITVTPPVTAPPQDPPPASNPVTSSGDVHVVDTSRVVTPVKLPGEVKDVPGEGNSPIKDVLEEVPPELNKAMKEIATLKEMLGQYIRKQDDRPGDPAPAQIEIDEGSLVARTLYLTPKTLMLFDIAKADGYPGALSEYLNDIVSSFYAKRGLSLGLVTRREIV